MPSYALYFAAYEVTKNALLCILLSAEFAPAWLSRLVPLVGGAAAGVAAWIPVYPIDVVKTNVQVCGVQRVCPASEQLYRGLPW